MLVKLTDGRHCAGGQQLLCRHQQTALGISSSEMLLYTAAPKSVFLLLVGPTLDRVITQSGWVYAFDFTPGSCTAILSTCLLAVGVNLSQFMCLNRCSAAAYQVRYPHPVQSVHRLGTLSEKVCCCTVQVSSTLSSHERPVTVNDSDTPDSVHSVVGLYV